MNHTEFFEKQVGAILVLGIMVGIAWVIKWIIDHVVGFFRKK